MADTRTRRDRGQSGGNGDRSRSRSRSRSREAPTGSLWEHKSIERWEAELTAYTARLTGTAKTNVLIEHDQWLRTELPGLVTSRVPAYMTRDELVRVVVWKMMRGSWRPANKKYAESNDEDAVRAATAEGFAAVARGDLAAAVEAICSLKGIGPATASAVLAVYAPGAAPFMDDAMVQGLESEGLGKTEYKTPFYLRYAELLKARAAELTERAAGSRIWTPQDISQALWSSAAHLVAKKRNNIPKAERR